MQETPLLRLAASCLAGLGCGWGAEMWEGFCPAITHSSPGLAVEAARVIPVASGRSCQSGQAETPPHANVASRRAYATLARASATWATLHHPWSLLWRLHPLGPCPPPARKGPQDGLEKTSGTNRPHWHKLSPVHRCGVFSPAGETFDDATRLGGGR